MLRIGIFSRNLMSEKPRGVVRVGRALAEAIYKEADVIAYAIGAPYKEMLVDALPLGDFLRQAPMNISHLTMGSAIADAAAGQALPFRTRVYSFCARRLLWVLHPAIWTPFQALAKVIGATAAAERIHERILRERLPTRFIPVATEGLPHPLNTTTTTFTTSLNWFDAVISFEAFEDIWDWPIENCDCVSVGYFHDAVPLRLSEGPGGRPDHFLRGVAKMVLRADRIICVSTSALEDIHEFFPKSIGKSTLVQNGHDVWRFKESLQRDIEAQRSARSVRLLMVGDIDRRKNVQTVLRALPFIKRELGDRELTLTIAGNPAQRNCFSSLERIARKYATIDWCGYVPDTEIAAAYRDCDVFLFPSLWEGFGIPILEAMSSGAPVVTSDLSSMPEVGGDFAFYCDPYDPKSIAEATLKAIGQSPHEARDRRQGAMRWAGAFTWERSAHQLIEVVKDAVLKGRARLPSNATLPNSDGTEKGPQSIPLEQTS